MFPPGPTQYIFHNVCGTINSLCAESAVKHQAIKTNKPTVACKQAASIKSAEHDLTAPLGIIGRLQQPTLYLISMPPFAPGGQNNS